MRHTRWLGAALLVVAVLVAYAGVTGCGFVWDDDDYVTQNPVLRTLPGLWRIWFEPTSLPQYYPLVHTTFWLEYRLWGTDPLGYHVVNVLLHAGSAVVLWRVLSRLAVPGALLGALWFAVHPVHVESVAWVTERKNVLSLLCYLLAARAFLRWHEGLAPRGWWRATAWFVAALLSKTVAASLPAALLVVLWWRHGRIGARELRATAPWFVLGAALGWFTVHLEATHVGAAAALHLEPLQRLLIAGRAVWFYLGSLLWPWPLCFNYPRWQLDTGSLLQWSFVLTAVAAPLLAWWQRRRIGRGPLAAMLLFGGTLVPAIGFFDVYPFRFSFVADHFQYHASVAMIAAAAALLVRCVPRSWPARAPTALGGAVATALLVLTARQLPHYRDEVTLWQATLRCNPRSVVALVNLGGNAFAGGDLEATVQFSERALAIDPRSYESLANLGAVAHRRNDLDAARRYYEAAHAIKADYASNLRNLAALHLQQGRAADALPLVQRAVELDPDYYDGRATLASTLAALQRWPECLQQAEWVLQRTPDAFETRLRAIDALLGMQRYERAVELSAELLRRMPSFEQVRRGFAKAAGGLLQKTPPERVVARAATLCERAGLSIGDVRASLANELRALGANAQADALR
ncbi:MAG: tetratricopeptide repeat protein [Planctomycetes bacterium]|nr:tetratricopeptide repeat protein [Planctomycetota bacterium]MCB9885974.1 tetratricopeptide repeat protein [Planctomycetota bacterium]